MASISLWAGEGCLFSSIATLLDAFSIAELWHRKLAGPGAKPLFETRIITTDGLPVTAWGGMPVQPHSSIRDLTRTDCIVIAPFLPNLSPMPDNLDILLRSIHGLRQKGAILATICTGTFILAEMGLLDGKQATTNWQFARLFKKRYPGVRLTVESLITEDDGIICTGAVTAVYNLALTLIGRFGSQPLAAACSKAFLMDPGRQSQTPYMISMPMKNHGDPQVLKAQQLIENQYADIETIDAIAGDVGISPRHFKRRFKKATGELPLKYLQRVRIDAAKTKLETTSNSIDEITWAVGYQDVSSFCRLFKQHTNLSPGAYRDKFFAPGPW